MKHFIFLIGALALFTVEGKAQSLNLETTQLEAVNCNSAITSLTGWVKADLVAGATNYRFRFIKNGLGSDTVIVDRPFRNLQLTLIALDYNQTYNVDIAVTLNGMIGEYGDVCTITTIIPVTLLAPLYCSMSTSNLASQVFAVNVIGATNYRFRFINGSDTLIKDRPYRSLYLNTVPGITYGLTYKVDIQVTSSGVTGEFGDACIIRIFLPKTQLAGQYCGYVTQSISSGLVKAAQVSGATNYRFRLINGNDTLIVDRPFRALPFSQVPLEFNKVYNVDVAATVQGLVCEYGEVCTLTTDFPITQLAPLYCGSSPGSMNSQLFAMFAAGATNYRFRLISGTDTLIIDRPYRSLPLSEPSILGGTTYSVDVQVTAGGVVGDYGPVCTVTTPQSSFVISDIQKGLVQEEGIVFETTLAPNPFNDVAVLNINSNDTTAPVSVFVYDGTGRLIESRLVDLTQETDIRIGTEYNSGFYQAIIIQNGNKKTARIVKQ